MQSSRKSPWCKAKTPSGIKVKYDFQDLTWGIKRIRKTFNTVEEAKTYHHILLKNAMSEAKGERETVRYFGEAVIEYLQQIESEKKLSQDSDKTDLNALRWPFLYNKQFYRLEELPLHEREGGVIWGLNKYRLDLAAVVKRSYINHNIYHQRKEPDGLVWYEQPSPSDNSKPCCRERVTCQKTLDKLNASKGRGAFSVDTVRRRLSVAKTLLHSAWHDWRWLESDISALIKMESSGSGRIAFLTSQQFTELVNVSDKSFGYLIKGGKSIGWRRSNLIGLTWDRVVWPQTVSHDDGTVFKSPGYLFIPKLNRNNTDPADLTQRRTRTKNKDSLETVMSPEIEALLLELWNHCHQNSNIVFHDGTGKYWGDFRKRWATAKKRAGIAEEFRWHDLRHTWATDRINDGVPEHIIMEEQGWKDPNMVRRYAHIQREARYAALTETVKETG